MFKDAKPASHRIDRFLLGPGGRVGDLVETAKAWAVEAGDRAK